MKIDRNSNGGESEVKPDHHGLKKYSPNTSTLFQGYALSIFYVIKHSLAIFLKKICACGKKAVPLHA